MLLVHTNMAYLFFIKRQSYVSFLLTKTPSIAALTCNLGVPGSPMEATVTQTYVVYLHTFTSCLHKCLSLKYLMECFNPK